MEEYEEENVLFLICNTMQGLANCYVVNLYPFLLIDCVILFYGKHNYYNLKQCISMLICMCLFLSFRHALLELDLTANTQL